MGWNLLFLVKQETGTLMKHFQILVIQSNIKLGVEEEREGMEIWSQSEHVTF